MPIAFLLFSDHNHLKMPGVHKQEKVIEIAPGKFVGGDHPCFVLAEAGINHNGEMDNAKSLIDLAKLCGVSRLRGFFLLLGYRIVAVRRYN